MNYIIPFQSIVITRLEMNSKLQQMKYSSILVKSGVNTSVIKKFIQGTTIDSLQLLCNDDVYIHVRVVQKIRIQ